MQTPCRRPAGPRPGLWLAVCFLSMVLAPGPLQAGDPPPPGQWLSQAELAFVNTTGNSDVSTLAAKARMAYGFSTDFTGRLRAEALYGQTDNVKSAERYLVEARLDHALTPRFYLGAIGGWEQDRFAGIDHRYRAGGLAGYRLLRGPAHFLTAEAGPEYVHEIYSADRGDEHFARGRLHGLYEYAFGAKDRFSQALEYLHNFNSPDRYRLRSTTALVVGLSEALSLKVSYEVNYTHRPVPETLKTTDTLLAVALVVNF